MDLARALRLGSTPCLAFVGAGGKSTALFLLARQLSSPSKLPVLVTTTTHLHVDQARLTDSHWVGTSPADFASLEENLRGILLVTGPAEKDRLTSLPPETLAWLQDLAGYHDLPLLVEADGSRLHPLKAPAESEPPIPAFMDSVVVVAGLSGLGQALAGKSVHRPEIFSALSGLSLGAPVTTYALTRVLSHPSGGLKNIPPTARRIVLLNQADEPRSQALAGGLARHLVPPYDLAVVASLQAADPVVAVHEPVAAVILAAGEARRFGRPKQLLSLHGAPFIRRVAEVALLSGLAPVIVVTGAAAPKVEAAVEGLPVQVVRNDAWAEGQASSVRAGVQVLPANTGACFFLLADQPLLNQSVLTALLEKHQTTLAPVIAPLVGERRGNPVLFDHLTFPDLLTLQGDTGGRALFSKFPPLYLDWLDESLLVDIDTPADLEKWKDRLE